MRVLINAAHIRFGGALQVALSFINECKKFHNNQYFICLSKNLESKIDQKQFPSNFRFYTFDFGEITFLKSFKINRILKELEKEIKPNIVFSNSGPTYFHSKVPQIIGFNLPLYIYPETPFFKTFSFFDKLKFGVKKQFHRYFFKRDAVAFVTQTEDVKNRVSDFLNSSNVYTITNNFNHYFNSPELINQKFLPKSEDAEFRFVTISAYYKHKDLELIPKISKYLKLKGINNIKFILTLENEIFNKLVADDNVINIGPVLPKDCPQLYFECDALFLPTLAECFSASYAESMKMERPIITTDLGFAKSICGDAALYFRPSDVISATDEILRLVSDSSLREKLVDTGKLELEKFDTAEERAIKYLDLCKQFSQ